MKLIAFLCACLLLLFSVQGCATKPVARCTSPGDTSEHHYNAGMEALERGDLLRAENGLDRALYCNERFAPAQGGLAVVHAIRSAQAQDPEGARVERERAFECIRLARKGGVTEADAFQTALAVIRVHTALQGKGWLKGAENAYARASRLSVEAGRLLYYGDTPSLDYFMGLAYLQAQQFQRAREMFARVLKTERGGRWSAEADLAWRRTDRIARAAASPPAGSAARRIAVRNLVTRADLCALLVDELKMEALFARRNLASPASPTPIVPADLVTYPSRNTILLVTKWGIRGLEPRYDSLSQAYLFQPEEKVKRGEMALVIEDLLIRLTGDEKMPSLYLGHEKSPFPDIRPTSPFYNAVLTVTTKGIMEADSSGDFGPANPIAGADAVLAVRALQEKMTQR